MALVGQRLDPCVAARVNFWNSEQNAHFWLKKLEEDMRRFLFLVDSLIGGMLADWRILDAGRLSSPVKILVCGLVGTTIFAVAVASFISLAIWAWPRASQTKPRSAI